MFISKHIIIWGLRAYRLSAVNLYFRRRGLRTQLNGVNKDGINVLVITGYLYENDIFNKHTYLCFERKTEMKKSIKVLFMSVILIVSTVFGGCSKSSKPADNGISDGTAANVITDMGGFEVTLPDKIERVVSTSDPCTDMMVAFGQSDKLVGAYFRALENPWFSVFCKDVDKITSFDSYEPEAEALIALNTDIIFVPSSERAESLREKGICAITIHHCKLTFNRCCIVSPCVFLTFTITPLISVFRVKQFYLTMY